MKVMRSGFGVAVLSLSAIAAGYFGGRPLLERVEFSRAQADVEATRQQLSTVEDLSTIFRHVGQVVEPSVVEIKVTKTVKETSSDAPNDQLRKYFQRHFGDSPFNFDLPNNGNGNGDDQGSEVERGTGSGVIVDVENGNGYVLTNNHVAGDVNSISVMLADGRTISGSDVKVIGADPKSDLAVVQIKADRLIPAKWGNSDDLEKGDWIMAFGAPFGYVGSMTHGIVSALNRTTDVEDKNVYQDFIQVDAPINPGNSGGPLVNIHGEVVGINTAIATVSGGFQGIGFAIPSNEAKTVYDSLRTHGKVVRGWLGVSIGSVADDPETAKYFGYTGTSGVMVNETFPGTPAFGKLHRADIITAVNGKTVDTSDQLRNSIAAMTPNSQVTLRVFREGHDVDVIVTLGDQPSDLNAVEQGSSGNQNAPNPDDTDQSSTVDGMTLKTLDADTAQSLGLSGVRSGAIIASVDPSSPAASAGLAAGVVITEVGKTPVHNAREAIDALRAVDLSKGGVPLYIATHEGSQFVFLKAADSAK